MRLLTSDGRACAVAIGALLLGAAAYPLLRHGAQPALWSGQLPALLHAFGFGVLLLVVLRPWPRCQGPVLVAWLVLLLGAECLQLGPSAPQPADAVAARTVEVWGLADPQLLLRAHSGGTFDPLDLLATALGVLAAWGYRVPLPRTPQPVPRAPEPQDPPGEDAR